MTIQARKTYAERVCELCGNKYIPTSGVQKHCPACQKIKRNEGIRKLMKERRARIKNGEKVLPYCFHCRGRALKEVVTLDEHTVQESCTNCNYTETISTE